MTLISPDIGEQTLLKYMVGALTVGSNLHLHLYISPTTDPQESWIYSTLTTAAGITGYAVASLAYNNWTVATASGVTTATYNTEISFNFTAAATVYGYAVTDSTDTYLLWIEKFSAAPFTLPPSGGTISITPRISLD